MSDKNESTKLFTIFCLAAIEPVNLCVINTILSMNIS